MGIPNLALYVFFCWIMISLLAFPNIIKESFSQKRYLFFIVFLLFYFLSTSIGKDLFQGVVYTLYMMRVVSPILMYDIIRTCDCKTKRVFVLLLITIFILYAVWMFSLIMQYGVEFGLKNSIYGTDSDERVGSAFGYIYSLPILVATMILFIRCYLQRKVSKKSRFKWVVIFISLSVVALFTFLVISSLFMTATILLLLGVSLALFYHNGKHWIVKIVGVIVLLSIIFVSQYETILNTVSLLGSSSTDQRVEEVFFLMTGRGNEAQDFSSRGELSNVSINTFLSYPVFGANHLAGFNRYDNELIGNHAEWFDMLALYGVFAFLLFSLIYHSLKKQYIDKGSNLPAYMYILTGFLNPIFCFTVNLVVFVIAPLISPTLRSES